MRQLRRSVIFVEMRLPIDLYQLRRRETDSRYNNYIPSGFVAWAVIYSL